MKTTANKKVSIGKMTHEEWQEGFSQIRKLIYWSRRTSKEEKMPCNG